MEDFKSQSDTINLYRQENRISGPDQSHVEWVAMIHISRTKDFHSKCPWQIYMILHRTTETIFWITEILLLENHVYEKYLLRQFSPQLFHYITLMYQFLLDCLYNEKVN